jgi:putative transcriptional regulator
MAREVRMTSEQAKAHKSNVDWAKVHATTSEDDIRRHQIEDGFDPDEEIDPSAWRMVVSASAVRAKLGMSQPQFAALINVPVATIRNWEQDRVVPDAAAKTLLAILWREPEAALRALQAVA